MTRTRLIGLALFAALAISAVAAATASALQWLLDGRPIAKAVGVETPESLLLADLAAPGGTLAINCSLVDKGTVGPGEKGEASTLAVTRCEFQRGDNALCEASGAVTVLPVNLPWLTLLLSVGGVTHDMIFGDAHPLGWNVTCTVAGILKVVDECTSAAIAPDVVNLSAGVDRNFLGEVAACSGGTRTSGMVIGTGLTGNPKGHTLSVSP